VQTQLLELMVAKIGHSAYESGHHGNLWLDLDRLFARPALLRLYVTELGGWLIESGADAICGHLKNSLWYCTSKILTWTAATSEVTDINTACAIEWTCAISTHKSQCQSNSSAVSRQPSAISTQLTATIPDATKVEAETPCDLKLGPCC